MLPVDGSVSSAELAACRRLLAQCTDALWAETRRLQLLDLSGAVGGSCATALASATEALGGELRAVTREVEGHAALLGRVTGS
jgi:hypothetical protein